MNEIGYLFRRNAENLERANVAKQKLRLRQYTLYETDPQGRAFGDWAVRPTIDHANKVFSSLVKRVSLLVPRPLPIDDHIRWLFRLLTLRVGKDRGWSVASDLDRRGISAFCQRANTYPTPWLADQLPSEVGEQIAEDVLDTLESLNFESIDPILIVKAFRIPALRSLRKRINLFPTPRPYAWDMMSSIPLHAGMAVCDPTVGTGTFLVAAGHALWSGSGMDDGQLSPLRQVLHGADSSALSVDFARIALDLAFGWDETGWRIEAAPASTTISNLSHEKEWVIVGNPPWQGQGRSQNVAGEILSDYVDAISERPAGWIATIVPRTVWTSRSTYGESLRKRVAERYQVESVWELPWDAITGGRTQAIASVISRGSPSAVTTWKRVGSDGVVHRVGYNSPGSWSKMRPVNGPDAHFICDRFAKCESLGEWYNVRVGMQRRSRKDTRLDAYLDGDIPYIEARADIEREYAIPRALLNAEIIRDDSWISDHFAYPAAKYRSELHRLPQLSMPQNIYEDLSTLSVCVFNDPVLLSNSFLICTPRKVITDNFARGIATILTSSIGRLWLHLFAIAGRHLAKMDVERFPLPSREAIEEIGAIGNLRARYVGGTRCNYEAAVPNNSVESQLAICRGYELELRESAVLLSLGHLLGFNDRLPQSVLDSLAPDAVELEQMIRKLETVDIEREPDQGRALYARALAQWDQRRYLVLDGDGWQIAIGRLSVAE